MSRTDKPNQTADITAVWSEEDGEWVGLCKAYPSLSWLAITKEEAEAGIASLVEDIRNGRA